MMNADICFFRKRPYFLAKCGDEAEQCVVLTQWHHEQCADAADLIDALSLRRHFAVTIVGPDVGEVDDAPGLMMGPRVQRGVHCELATSL